MASSSRGSECLNNKGESSKAVSRNKKSTKKNADPDVYHKIRKPSGK